MPFVRTWDASCPRVYSRWEADGATWTVQDLMPDDDKVATEAMLTEFLTDEIMCNSLEIHKSPDELSQCYKFWHDKVLPERMSLACYHEKDGVRTLAGVNACVVICRDDAESDAGEVQFGAKFKLAVDAINHLSGKVDVYTLLGVDKLLYGYGLLVRRQFRGARIGRRLLEAREPLCKSVGIRGTATVFSGPVSSKLAAEVGFKTVAEISMKQYSEAGYHFPGDGGRMVKYMARMY